MISIDTNKIDISIEMIKKYVKECNIAPLIQTLEKLKQEPHDESHLEQLSEKINELGIAQGAVLTYAPYVSFLLSNDLFEDN